MVLSSSPLSSYFQPHKLLKPYMVLPWLFISIVYQLSLVNIPFPFINLLSFLHHGRKEEVNFGSKGKYSSRAVGLQASRSSSVWGQHGIQSVLKK